MKKVILNLDILKEENIIAKKNRKYFSQNRIFVVNLMGSPGCGKTTLIEEIIKKIKDKLKIAVIEGDIATVKDARRISKLKIPVVQINTEKVGNACHLNAGMIRKAIESLKSKKIDILIIENIGNLVCPAEFDLGENLRIVMTSVTEGDDKVAKYPPMFANCDIVIISKIDLIKYSKYNLKQVEKDIRRINPKAVLLKITTKRKNTINSLIEILMREKGYAD